MSISPGCGIDSKVPLAQIRGQNLPVKKEIKKRKSVSISHVNSMSIPHNT